MSDSSSLLVRLPDGKRSDTKERHPSADAVIKLRDLLARHSATLPLPDSSNATGKISRDDIGALARALSAGVIRLNQDLGAWQRGDAEIQGITAEYLQRKLGQWYEALPHDKAKNSLREKAKEAIHEAKNTGLFDTQIEAYIRSGGKKENYELLERLQELVALHISHLIGIKDPNIASTKGAAISEEETDVLTRRIASNWEIFRTIGESLRVKQVDTRVLTGKLDALVQFVEQHPVPPMGQLLGSIDKDDRRDLDKIPFLDRLKGIVSSLKGAGVFQESGRSEGRSGRE